MVDFIGDIHGYVDKLIELLEKLGYSIKNGVYNHPARKVLFIGDYIDRGPKIRETLKLVRQMVESDNAIALMGNHEYNALCFHYEEREGGHLRKHSIKNIIQHYQTLRQFQNWQSEYDDYLEWFKTMPLYYETDEFRAVHAGWDSNNISLLRLVLKNDRLNETLIHQSVIKDNEIYRIIDETLKGKEIRMPLGLSFHDKDDTERTKIRIKWWEDPVQSTFREISVISLGNLPESPMDISLLHNISYYHKDEKPVFFGHYGLNGQPDLFRKNVCCLDYGVAKKGFLVAYRFDGEKELSNDKFIFV